MGSDLNRELKMESCSLRKYIIAEHFRDPHKVNELERKTKPKVPCFLRKQG